MHSMLKKTLLATAVAAASVANIQAQEITGSSSEAVPMSPAIIISSEGLAIDPTITVGPTAEITVNYETNATINVNDLLVLTFTGADIASSSVPTLNNDNVEIIDTDTNSLTFRVVNGSVAATTFALDGVTLENVTGSVSVSGVTQIPGTGIEFNEADAAVVAVVASQFAFNTTTGTGADGTNRVFDGTIDVEQMRAQFTAGSVTGGVPPSGSDRLADSITLDNFFVRFSAGNADEKNVTVANATVALTGEDFGFLLDEDGELDTGSFQITGFSGAADGASSLEGNTLTVSSTDDPGGYVGIALATSGAGPDSVAVNAQDFTADVSIGYNLGPTTGSVSSTGFDAGAWDLSGAEINIPFMPYGASVAQLIRISNDGTVTGEIELTAFDDEGLEYGPIQLDVSAVAGTVTNIGPAVAAALAAEGFDGTGSVDLTFVVNSPAADIEIAANYRIFDGNTDRVSVIVENPDE